MLSYAEFWTSVIENLDHHLNIKINDTSTDIQKMIFAILKKTIKDIQNTYILFS